MEIPVINRISVFDGAISSFSRVFENIPQPYSFWKLGAFLLLAFLATFSTIFNRINFFLFTFRRHYSYPVSDPLLSHAEVSCDDDDDDDVSSSDDEYDDEGVDDDDGSSFENSRDDFDDYRVAGGSGSDRFHENQWQYGKFKLWRRRSSIGDCFSWSEFASGKSVVKLWDGLGLGLNNSSGSVLSIYDLNSDQTISSTFGSKCQISAVSASSPAVNLSAGVESSRNFALKVWDRRVSCQIPAIFAEWKPVRGKVVGINSSGVEKVYVMDDVSGKLMVRDMRRVNSLLEYLTESDGDTWLDADAVIVSNECRR